MPVRFAFPAQGSFDGLCSGAASALAAVLTAAALAGCEPKGVPSPAPPAVADEARIREAAAPMTSADPKPEPVWKCLPRAVAEFGEVPLDTPVSGFPWGARRDLEGKCTQECSFTWRDDVEYVLDGEFVFQKFLHVGRTQAQLPLGLTATSDMGAARAALASHDPEVSIDREVWRNITGEDPPFEEGDVLSALLCPGEAGINFHFDTEGRLRVVWLRANTSGT